MHRLFLFLSLILSNSLSYAEIIGFTETNSFLVEPYKGEVYIQCRYTGKTVEWKCQTEMLNHEGYEYFYFPKNEATHFTLRAHHADGTVTEKSGKFLGPSGRSALPVNLWIRTVLQTPLLRLGENKVEYVLSKESKIVAQGTFKATVFFSDKRTFICPSDSMYNQDREFCEDSEFACEAYFNNVFRFCKPESKAASIF